MSRPPEPMAQKLCDRCNKPLPLSGFKYQRFCSNACSRNPSRKYHRPNGVPSGTTGAMGELMASGRLLSLGWQVFRAVSPACFCDLVAVKGPHTLFIEVRVGKIYDTNGRLCYSKNRSDRATPGISLTYAVVTFDPDPESFSFFPPLPS